MKGLKANVSRGITTGTFVKVADNSGAKDAMIISVRGFKGRTKRQPSCGVGDVVTCTVKTGNTEMKHQKVQCVVIRQRKEYRRKSGVRVKFEDNAVIVMKDIKKGEPKGTVIKGPIAREAIERFNMLTKIASIVA